MKFSSDHSPRLRLSRVSSLDRMEDINEFLSRFQYPHRHPFFRNTSDSSINSQATSDNESRSLHQEIVHLMPSSDKSIPEGDGSSPGLKFDQATPRGVEYPRRYGQIRSPGEISHQSRSPIDIGDQHNIQEYSDIHQVQRRHARRSHIRRHPSTPTHLLATRLLASHVEPPLGSPVRIARPNSRMRRVFQEAGLESNSQMATSVADDDDTEWETDVSTRELNMRGQ